MSSKLLGQVNLIHGISYSSPHYIKGLKLITCRDYTGTEIMIPANLRVYVSSYVPVPMHGALKFHITKNQQLLNNKMT